MIDAIVEFGTKTTETWGYLGIFLTQTLESAMIPIPSEVVLTLGGFMASLGQLNLFLVILVATAANLAGSLIAYWLGAKGGRPMLEKYGKYMLITQHEIEKMDHLFQNHGRKVAFIARVLPGIRTFSSLIIGSGRLNIGIFVWYTILGSAIWNGVLAVIGYGFGSQWEAIRPYFKKFEIVILAVIVIFVVWFIWHRIRQIRAEERVHESGN